MYILLMFLQCDLIMFCISNLYMFCMQLIHNLEAGSVRDIKPVSDGEERSSSSLRLDQLKASC